MSKRAHFGFGWRGNYSVADPRAHAAPEPAPVRTPAEEMENARRIYGGMKEPERSVWIERLNRRLRHEKDAPRQHLLAALAVLEGKG